MFGKVIKKNVKVIIAKVQQTIPLTFNNIHSVERKLVICTGYVIQHKPGSINKKKKYIYKKGC